MPMTLTHAHMAGEFPNTFFLGDSYIVHVRGFAVHYIALSKRSPFRSLLWVKAQKFQLVRLVHCWLFPVISSYMVIQSHRVISSHIQLYIQLQGYIQLYKVILVGIATLMSAPPPGHSEILPQTVVIPVVIDILYSPSSGFVIFDTRTFSPINLGKVIILSNGLGPLSIIRSCDQRKVFVIDRYLDTSHNRLLSQIGAVTRIRSDYQDIK